MAYTPGCVPEVANVGSFKPFDSLSPFGDSATGLDGKPLGYKVWGIGTRNFGSGTINVKGFPKREDIESGVGKAFLIYNTYVPNNLGDPTVTYTPPNSAAEFLTPGLYCLTGSTCWVNTVPTEQTTYLRNRVYLVDVTPTFIGDGPYSISGLPVNVTMPIGIDGDRLPGCDSSQGAILYAWWQWLGDKGPKPFLQRQVKLRSYLGAKLITPNPGPNPYGGAASYTLKFNPGTFIGNAKTTFVAGDVQNTIPGKKISVNSTLVCPGPPCVPLFKQSPSIALREWYIENIYLGGPAVNSATISTTSDCINWFFFAISSDNTEPKAKFTGMPCCSTKLKAPVATIIDNFIDVVSNSSPNPIVANCPATVGNVVNKNGHPFYVKIDGEIMKVISSDADDPLAWSVVRGVAGTVATTHSAGACVRVLMPKESYTEQQAALVKKSIPRQRNTPGRWRGRRLP